MQWYVKGGAPSVLGEGMKFSADTVLFLVSGKNTQ